jgi:DNA polymerase-3 subunit epsilon
MENNSLLTALPIKNGRYVILDTETTGVNAERNNIIELACIEISKGKITGQQFHCYLRPRYKIDIKAQAKHKLHPTFYEDYFSDVYAGDKATLETFLKFIGNSIVFAHNATFDINFINNELKFWKLPPIPKGRFRCTMRIFKNIFGPIDHRLKKYCSLAKCCEFFNLKSSRENFHTAIFDSFMTARLVCKFYEFVESHNINITNLANMNLAVVNADKYLNVKNIRTGEDINAIKRDEIGSKDEHIDLNYDVDQFHKENVNPNEMKVDEYDAEDEPEYIEPDDVMNIIEEHGGFIENYMNDENINNDDIDINNIDKGLDDILCEDNKGLVHTVNEIDINMVDDINIKEETKDHILDIDKTSVKNKYKDMMKNFYSQVKLKDEKKDENFQLTNEELAGIEDIIKNNI